MFESMALRARRVPLLLRLPFILAPFAAMIYWIWTESGPYAWLAVFQANFLNGDHYVVVSGLGALLLPLIPAMAIIQGLASFFPEE